MTRKTAIRLLAGAAGLFGAAVRGQTPGEFRATRITWQGNAGLPIAEIILDREAPESKAAYDKCQQDEVDRLKRSGGPNPVLWGACVLAPERIPGTSVLRIHLEELEAIEVTLSGQTRRITRQELWEAL